MACTTINGLLKSSCDGNNVGGIYSVYIADQLDVSGYTTDVSGSTTGYTITTLNMVGGAKHKKFEFNRNIGSLAVETAVDLIAGSTVHKATITLKFLRREASKSRAIQILGEGQRYLSIIIKDALGQYSYVDFAQISGGGENTGTLKTDGSSYDVILTADLDQKPFFVLSSVVTGVVDVP